MNIRRTLITFALLIAGILFNAAAATACTCAQTSTVLDAYEGSSIVLIARAVSVEKAAPGTGPRMDLFGIHSTKLQVVKVYKGEFKPLDEMIFAQGGIGDCVWTFTEQSVGQEFLLFLGPRNKQEGMWRSPQCSRSSAVEHAEDDLRFLDNLAKNRGKTRISGKFGSWDNSDLIFSGIKVSLVGGKKTIELVTDENGVFEVYDVAPGDYEVRFMGPKGWNVGHISGTLTDLERMVRTDFPLVRLEPGRHAEVRIYFKIDNTIAGTVRDPAGNPLPDLCLDAIDPDPAVVSGRHFDCTDKDGGFSIHGLPRGKYILVLNQNGTISAGKPLRALYYPDATDRAQATVLFIGAGETIEGLAITVPQLAESVTVQGVLRYSDGKPVAEEIVKFEPDVETPGVSGTAMAKTDAQGRFSLKILKGQIGKLSSWMFAYVGKFEKCPQIDQLVKASGHEMTSLTTPEVPVTADKNLDGLTVTFPFPRCEQRR